MWVPGDNDWTDCWGRYGPSTLPVLRPARAARARAAAVHVDRPEPRSEDADAHARVERGRPVRAVLGERPLDNGPVVYIGLNVQGSNDNYPYAGVDGETPPAGGDRPPASRGDGAKAADIHWLHEGFEYAKQVDAKGVMVIQQADLNFNNEQHLADTRSWDAFPD